MNLYEITAELQTLFDTIIENDGEITPEQEEQLAVSREALTEKAESYCKAMANLNAEIDGLKAEEQRIAKRRRTEERLRDRLKENLKNAMQAVGESKMDAGTFRLSLRNSEAVEVDDSVVVSSLPEDLYTVKYEVSKSACKDYLKSGGELEGVRLVQRQNLNIR